MSGSRYNSQSVTIKTEPVMSADTNTMSGSRYDSQSVTIKTEPVDSFLEDSYNDAALLNNKSAYLQDFSNEDPVRVHSKHETMKGVRKYSFHDFTEIAEKLNKLKRNNSDDDPECDSDFKISDFHEVEEVELSDTFEEGGYESYECDSQYSRETSNMEEPEDRKPSQEELEMISRGLNLKQSVHGWQHVSSEAASVSDDIHVGKMKQVSKFSDENLDTPRVVLPRLSASQLCSFPGYRYTKPSLTKTINNRMNFIETEIMKPIFSDDGVVTSYQCVQCSKRFVRRQTLRQHFITHTDRFACPCCVARCKSKGDLERHIQTHTKVKPFHCTVCNSNYARLSILKKHRRTQRHLRSLLESKNVARMKMIRKKQKPGVTSITGQADGRLGLSCRLCLKVSFSRPEYRKHIKSHTLKFICDICQKGCQSLPLLKMHKRSHSKSNSLVCKVCFRSFVSFHFLKEHTKSHKSGGLNRVAKGRFLNSTIGKQRRFLQAAKVQAPKIKLESAEVDHVSESIKELKCENCYKQFSSSRQLASHKCMPADTYICGICNKTFPKICKLKIHLKLHSKIIKCDICDIIFYEETELEEHIQEEHVYTAHTGGGADELMCTLCYECFETASDLRDHMKDHAPIMLFSGKSLDEKETAPMVTQTKRTKPASVANVEIKTEVVSESEDESVSKRAEKVESDDDSIVDSKDFFEILNRVLVGDDKDYEEGENDFDESSMSDTDEEMFSGIKAALENDVLSSDESDLNELEELNIARKPLVYSQEDIMKTHCAAFEKCSERDAKSQIFKCTLCCKVFEEDKYLKAHLKHHVCEFCNFFFNDTETLEEHKYHHEQLLVSQIKAETKRLCIPKKWKGFSDALSATENKLKAKRINRWNIKRKLSQADMDAGFLITLSHNEILQANKHNFENFSFSDPIRNIFECKVCKKDYARATTLTRHMKTHVCEFCSMFFEDKFDLTEHRYSHRKEAAVMKAEITGKDTTLRPCTIVSKPHRIKFKKYSFIDKPRNLYRCTLCQKDFVRRTVLTRHLKTHICILCDQFYEDKYELAKHYSYHSTEEHHLEKGQLEDVADRDELRKVDREEKLPVSSIVKDKNFRLKGTTSLLPYKPQPGFSGVSHTQSPCRTQNKKVSILQFLTSTSNETASPEVISIIPKASMPPMQAISQPVQMFLNTAHLAATSASHQDRTQRMATLSPAVDEYQSRPFECGECGKKFLERSHLLSHLTIHIGDRPIMCTHCGKSFDQVPALHNHLKTHKKLCCVCGSTFISKFALDLHMEVHKTSVLS